MAKRLTVSQMQKQDTKTYGVKREISVQGHTVLIDKVFRDSKVREVLVELVRNMDHMRRQGVSLDGLDINGYTSILLIKHFTDIDVPDKFEDQLSVLNIMIDNGYFKPILEAFDGEQVAKINDAINDILDNLDEKLALLKEQEEKFEAVFLPKKKETDTEGA